MSDFEPFDDELANALRRRAGRPTTSTAAAHDAVLRRAGAIRRRRVAVAGGGTMAVLLLGGILLLPRGVEEQSPAVSGDVLPSFDETSTSVGETMPVVDPVDDDAPVTVDPPVATVAPETTGPATSAPATSAPSTSAPSTSVPSTSAPSTSVPSTSAPSTSAPATSAPSGSAPFTDTYQSTGGAITVSWDGAALSLQAVSPAAGFVGEVEDSSPTRVRVRFESADDDSRIEVRVTDGRVDVDVD